jgi:hypothetical protein
MSTIIQQQEYLKKHLKSKDIYCYTVGGKTITTREVFIGKATVTQYPFYPSTAERKYKFIDSVTFHKISPKDVRGVYKDWKRGYGFTRDLSPLLQYLADNFQNIGRIVVSGELTTEFKQFEAVFNIGDLSSLYRAIRPMRQRHTYELQSTVETILSSVLPGKIKSKPPQYQAGDLANFLRNHRITGELLSDADAEALLETAGSSIQAHKLFSDKVMATREKIDLVYLDAVLDRYHKIMSRTTGNKKLEEDWHVFFRENWWILAQLLAYPMILFGDKAYLGGKDITNKSGKIADFIYKNKFSKNVAIVEIKTHLTRLVAGSPYRKPDVFGVHPDLAGPIVQVLDQRDTLQRSYNEVAKGKGINVFCPECIVVVGMINNLNKYQKKSLELFRSGNAGVKIVGFDELLERIEGIYKIFQKGGRLQKK